MLLSSPAMIRSQKLLRLGAVVVTLLTCTACLEHFEALWTRVVYDPFEQSFRVERRLIGVEARFLGCSEVLDCMASVERALEVAPDPGYSMALSDRLLQRLIESGATDVEVTLEREGDRLDVRVAYSARVGTPAADDTFVRAEWNGRGTRGEYSLVVSPQASMEPPERYDLRKVARGGAGEVDWVEEWVLPRDQREVRTEIAIEETNALFAEVPGLAEALEARGWLHEPSVLPPMPTSGSKIGSFFSKLADRILPGHAADRIASEPSEPSEPPPEAVLSPRGRSEEPVEGYDPSSPARTWVYEPRVSGGGVTPAEASVALEPLVPAISRCYQLRQQEVPELAGNVFLSALVRADGNVMATSVNGSLADAVLLRCIDRVLSDWRFEPWGTGSELSDVAVPVVFRVEDDR